MAAACFIPTSWPAKPASPSANSGAGRATRSAASASSARATSAQQLADEMELRFELMGLAVDRVERYAANEFGAQVPADTQVSPAFSLAAGFLAGRKPAFELLPPKVSAWQQMATRYSSGKLRAGLTAAGAVGVLVGGLFFYQQVPGSWAVEAEAGKLTRNVAELKGLQDQIRQYRDRMTLRLPR